MDRVGEGFVQLVRNTRNQSSVVAECPWFTIELRKDFNKYNIVFIYIYIYILNKYSHVFYKESTFIKHTIIMNHKVSTYGYKILLISDNFIKN